MLIIKDIIGNRATQKMKACREKYKMFNQRGPLKNIIKNVQSTIASVKACLDTMTVLEEDNGVIKHRYSVG